ncbi:MAG: AAA family ATPase [Candidatus Omnitrophota bacterium]
MKIFAIANQKGGCGKTTTATCLAAALAKKGKNVLLIDLDPQSHATIGLGVLKVDPFKSIVTLFTNDPEKIKKIDDISINLERGLDLVPSHIILSTIEQDLKERQDGLLILSRAIMRCAPDYNYIVIDCPPNLGFLTFNALRAAGEIIIPVETSAFAIMGVGKLISMVELIKIKLHHAPNLRGLVVMYDEYSDFSIKMLAKIKYIFKEKLFSAMISFDTAVRQAQEKTQSIFTEYAESRAAHDYLAMAEELLVRDSEESAKSVYQEMRKIMHGAYGNVYSKEKIFKLFAPKANDVYVVGDFNDWKVDVASKLIRSEEGNWEKSIYLLPGRYRYKFVADGLWLWDPENTEKEKNPYGDFDSVFRI